MKKLLNISRPRFWIYVAGPFWLCAAILYPSIHNVAQGVIFLLYFTFPANILIYGINDMYDSATDLLNDKKSSYEQVLKKSDRKKLLWLILATNIPFVMYGFFALPIPAFVCLIVFILLAWQYSAPPLRAKAIPFVDSIVSGLLYIVPAGVAWGIVANSYPSFMPMFAGFLWSYAMHLYSAVPDINADKAAHIKTGATLLGKNPTLILCGILYFCSTVIAFMYVGVFACIAAFGYLYLIVISIKKKSPEDVLEIYKMFPLTNAIMGAILFFQILLIR